jgi:hypothetical protein
MYTENVKKAIKLQTEINEQIVKFGWAQDELTDDLEKCFDLLNSYECEIICEWYNKQAKKSKEQYTQLEFSF